MSDLASFSKVFIKIDMRDTGLKSFRIFGQLDLRSGSTTASLQTLGTCLRKWSSIPSQRCDGMEDHFHILYVKVLVVFQLVIIFIVMSFVKSKSINMKTIRHLSELVRQIVFMLEQAEPTLFAAI